MRVARLFLFTDWPEKNQAKQTKAQTKKGGVVMVVVASCYGAS